MLDGCAPSGDVSHPSGDVLVSASGIPGVVRTRGVISAAAACSAKAMVESTGSLVVGLTRFACECPLVSCNPKGGDEDDDDDDERC